MKILHLDTGHEMRGGQWQAHYLMRGLRERGHEVYLNSAHGSFDIVHAHDAKAHRNAVLRGLKPLVVSRRVAFPVKSNLFSRWKYNHGHFIAVSQFVKSRLLEAGVDDSRVDVVYDGVPPLEPAPPSERIVVVDKRNPTSFDAASELPGARALVYLSEEEGLGSAILLAMSSGIPVVASRVGGIPEAVEDGVTGLLIDGELGDALDRITPGMAVQARERYQRLFTVERMVEATIAVYKKVAQCSR